MNIKTLLELPETDYLDFKSKWYSGDKGKFDLIHDILSLSNSPSINDDRYIIIGVSVKKTTKEKKYKNITRDKNRLDAEQIIARLSPIMNAVPNIEVKTKAVATRTYIDIIKITPIPRNLPYVLTKDYTYTDVKKGKLHTLPRQKIYSRNGERNTGVDEWCPPTTLEELFARKRGDGLPIFDRFAMYLDDYENWERVQGREDTYFYKKDHRFKVIRSPVDEDKHFPVDDMPCYGYLLNDFGISTDYWDFHKSSAMTYEDSAELFDVELFADNTSIGKYMITNFYCKDYFHRGNRMSPFGDKIYIPTMNDLMDSKYQKDENGEIDYTMPNITDKETLINSIASGFVFKICRMLYRKDYRYDSDVDTPYRNRYIFGYNYERVLDYLNLDNLIDSKYSEKNSEYIDEIVITQYMGEREWVKDRRRKERK